ncbi:hypothetical protein NLM27_08725 [Bradyrhizobium sp. CCGB12]|uniref:hypothetical protein n=1 Tax=Bradyrhizobium sp. CCGB12 TaxID=2949632 RepID=UPI0020B43F5C|nr:hypothetical protein [Bradyrhizobium sp. CCGB12]MCP3388859.1 hypothetical protein [Bradyrhizobium sp. CCGB12]
MTDARVGNGPVFVRPSSWHVMPIEIYRGHVLDPDQLEALRLQLENFATIDEVDPELRGIIERNWPHLAAKLPPEDA